MKKLVALLVVFTVVLGLLTSFVVYQFFELETKVNTLQNQVDFLETQKNELQNLVDKNTNIINITGFSTYGFNPQGGLLMHSYVNVTIQNFGINDVENLTLTINSSTVQSSNSTYTVDLLLSREKRVITGSLYWILGGTGTNTATLKIGDTILDEYSVAN